MSIALSLIAAASLQAWSGTGGMSHSASNEYEKELYVVMRAVKNVLPRECYAIRTNIDLGEGVEAAEPEFACLDKKGREVSDYTLERSAMPVEKIKARLPKLRDAVEKMDGDEPDGITLTVNRRGIIHSQFLFEDIEFRIG